jgi:hypothetical protein
MLEPDRERLIDRWNESAIARGDRGGHISLPPSEM